MRLIRRGLVLALISTAVLAAPAMADEPGALFTQTNNPAGNTVERFDRAADGTLTPAGTFATGGAGSAALGGRQGAVALSDDGRRLFAVNAGSDSVTVFRVRDMRVLGTVPSGGSVPASVDEHHGRLYVLNSGGTPNVTAFRLRHRGAAVPLGTSDLAPGAAGAAQVSVTPDGKRLVVTERVANRLETLALDPHGRPGAPVVTPSSGAVPFGFGITGRGTVVVSEAGASTVSSYVAEPDGALRAVTASLPVGQGAACWVAVSPNGRFAYTGNAAGGISGFAIGEDGTLTAAGTTALLPSPRDLEFDRGGRFLYAISPGGRVTGYRVGHDGALTEVTSAPAAAGITGAAAL